MASDRDRAIGALIREWFPLPETDLKTYSPLTLAFLGDGVFGLIVRSIVVGKGNSTARKLHKRTAELVNARAQSVMMEGIEDSLSEEEKAVFLRGRNAHPATMAKSASMREYRRATGFEALVGYLYLAGREERMMELIQMGMAYYERR